MNLRECTQLVIDHRQETFSYVFPQTTIVKPIVRPEMVGRVADLMKYAGAEIKVIREEDEEKRAMKTVTKMSNRTHSVHDMLVAVAEGRYEDVNGNALKRLKNDRYIRHDSSGAWHLTQHGRDFIGEVDAEVANTPALSEEGIKAAKAAHSVFDEDYAGQPVFEQMPNGNGNYAPKIEVYSAPCITIPKPSESERNLRRAAYASIRDGLGRALSAGQAMVPILDSLEATDPLLNGGAR